MNRGRRLLKDWLARSRKTQKELAAKIGVTEGYLSQILSGLRRPKLETLIAIQAETGVPLESWVATRDGKSDRRQIA